MDDESTKTGAQRVRGVDGEGRPTTWEGGRIRYRKDGEPVFIIDKMIKGHDWVKTLSVTNRRDALLEFVKFQQDPEGYISGIDEVATAIYLEPVLIQQYLAYSARPVEENGKENTRKWLAYKERALYWWAERLRDEKGRLLNLRRVKRSKHILPHLEGLPGGNPGEWKLPPARSARHKREAIKALYGWLRKHVGSISAAEDPVMDMPVGKGRVAQTQAGKSKVAPRENVRKVAEHLIAQGSRYGHALVVHAATGWHTTELVRFIAGGEIVQPVPQYLQEPGVVAILMTPKHKNGKRHFAKVGERAAFSARVLLGEALVSTRQAARDDKSAVCGAKTCSISDRRYYEAIKIACAELGLPKFSPGWMRHTSATFALEVGGATSKEVGKFLGHADGTMVANVYGPNAVPPKVPTIMDDPPAPTRVRERDSAFTSLIEKVRALEARTGRTGDARSEAEACEGPPDLPTNLEELLRTLKEG